MNGDTQTDNVIKYKHEITKHNQEIPIKNSLSLVNFSSAPAYLIPHMFPQ